MADFLPSDRIDLLVPLLRRVTELVVPNPQVGRTDLQLLLRAHGLDHDWAANELEHWVQILTTVRGVTDANALELAQRALMARGVPEAPALLAVDLVSASPRDMVRVSITLPKRQALPIYVHPEAIGFGELLAGQGASTQLRVSGGPGHVMVPTDFIAVQPDAFGPGETILTVSVRGGVDDQVLWSALVLQSAAESVEVAVTARWTHSLTPVVGPPGQGPTQPLSGHVAPQTSRPEPWWKQIQVWMTPHFRAGWQRAWPWVRAYPKTMTALALLLLAFCLWPRPKEPVVSPPDPQEAFRAGQAALGRGDHRPAVDHFTRALQASPSGLLKRDILNGRGRAYHAIRDYDAAITDYSAAIGLDATNAPLFHNRGLAYLARRDFDRAIADFSHAIDRKTDPRDKARDYQNRADAYAEKADWPSADRDLAASVQWDPANWPAWERIEVMRIASNDQPNYWADCQRLLADFGSTSDPLLANAVAWIWTLAPDSWRTRQAMPVQQLASLVERTMDRHPSKYLCLGTLGGVYYRAGQYDKAADYLQQAMTLHGKGGDIYKWLLLGLVHIQQARAEWPLGDRLGLRAPQAYASHRGQATEWLKKAKASLADNTEHEWVYRQELKALYREAELGLAALPLLPTPSPLAPRFPGRLPSGKSQPPAPAGRKMEPLPPPSAPPGIQAPAAKRDPVGKWTYGRITRPGEVQTPLTAEFRADGTCSSTEHPGTRYSYTFAGDLLSVFYTNPRGVKNLQYKGTIYEWAADGSWFRFRMDYDLGSVRTEGWKYEYRRAK